MNKDIQLHFMWLHFYSFRYKDWANIKLTEYDQKVLFVLYVSKILSSPSDRKSLGCLDSVSVPGD